jgi:hypothetical protein
VLEWLGIDPGGQPEPFGRPGPLLQELGLVLFLANGQVDVRRALSGRAPGGRANDNQRHALLSLAGCLFFFFFFFFKKNHQTVVTTTRLQGGADNSSRFGAGEHASSILN